MVGDCPIKVEAFKVIATINQLETLVLTNNHRQFGRI